MTKNDTRRYSAKDIKTMKAHGEVHAARAGAPEEIDPTHLEDVLKSLAQAMRREFAPDAEVEALRRFEGEVIGGSPRR